MNGQLEWEGEVHPIAELSWNNVLQVAQRFQGLNVAEDFAVTYKDEEGDLIFVKNDADLAEAVQWAQDQNVPCLCLRVPVVSADSDSDESWTDIVDRSPRAVPSAPAEVTRELSLAEESAATEDPPVTAEEPEVTGEDNYYPHHDAVIPTSDVAGQVQEEEVVETEEQEPEVTESPVAVEAPPLIASVSGNDLVEQYLDAIDLAVEGKSGLTPSEALKTLLASLAKPAFVGALAQLMSNSAVQNTIASLAQAELEQNAAGRTAKLTARALRRLLYQYPNLAADFMKIEDSEKVLVAFLRFLKEEEKEAPKVVVEAPLKSPQHNVLCDMCEKDRERAHASVRAGTRHVNGDILGIRYKSAVLPDFDLCESCEAAGAAPEACPFLKITDSSMVPEMILCVMPGASSAMFNQMQALDWRNPLASEFAEFVKSRQQNAFPQQRQARAASSAQTEAAPAVANKPVEVVECTVIPDALQALRPVPAEPRCSHALKTFTTPHGNFTCDICSRTQGSRSIMHGCRDCNFDVCATCQVTRNFPLHIEQRPVMTPAPLQPPPTVASALPSAGSVLPTVLPPSTSTIQPQAKFVSDVTLADGCVVRTSERLDKTWRVRNVGVEPWPVGTKIVHVGGDALGGPMSGVEVPLAAAGQAVNVTVPLVMPPQPGRYTSYWRMVTPHPANTKFGHRFWVTVNVVAENRNAGQVLNAAPTLVGSPARLPAPSAPAAPVVMRPTPPPPPPVVVASRAEEPVVRPEYETAVSQITELGFADIDKIVKVLDEVNGDTSRAVDRLLEG